MAIYPLNFGAFCQVLYNTHLSGIWKCLGERDGDRPPTHRDVVAAVLLLPYDDKAVEDADTSATELSDRDASHYFNNKRRVKKQIRAYASGVGLDVLQKNVEARILSHMNRRQQQLLLEGVSALVRKLKQDEDRTGLRDYLGLVLLEDQNSSTLFSRFLAKCVQFCLFMPNTSGERVNWGWFNPVPAAGRPGDPYRLVSDDPGSPAVTVLLRDVGGFQNPKSFYRFDLLTERIRKQSLIIKSISCDSSGVQVTYDRFRKNGYTLRRLGARDAETVRKFIRDHEQEFREKRGWRGRRLSDMAFDGLRMGKWMAYGYFDPEGEIISYLDAKLRLDGGVELGIALTDGRYRGMQLASGLICFFKLLFPHCRLFGGTYEGNKFMRKTFDATGFVRIMYLNEETKEVTQVIAERIDPEHPEDKSRDTNSVYYFCESLMAAAFRASTEKKATK